MSGGAVFFEYMKNKKCRNAKVHLLIKGSKGGWRLLCPPSSVFYGDNPFLLIKISEKPILQFIRIINKPNRIFAF